MSDEEWRPVAGWYGYEVSNFGRVRSIDRIIEARDGQRQLHRGRLLSQKRNADNYWLVHLRMPGRNAPAVRVHRLVAEAFIPNPDAKPNVNHLDCNPGNNAASNLEWCTQAENLGHMTALGRRCVDYWQGRRSPAAILTDEQAREIRSIYASGNASHQELARRFNISERAIGRLLNGDTYV